MQGPPSSLAPDPISSRNSLPQLCTHKTTTYYPALPASASSTMPGCAPAAAAAISRDRRWAGADVRAIDDHLFPVRLVSPHADRVREQRERGARHAPAAAAAISRDRRWASAGSHRAPTRCPPPPRVARRASAKRSTQCSPGLGPAQPTTPRAQRGTARRPIILHRPRPRAAPCRGARQQRQRRSAVIAAGLARVSARSMTTYSHQSDW